MKYDVIVVGSGPIAFTTSLMLEKANLKIAILSHKIVEQNSINAASRLFAIANKSYNSLHPLIDEKEFLSNAQPINHIRIVDNNSHSKVDFMPLDIESDRFGYMIDERILWNLLSTSLSKSSIDIYHSAIFDLHSNDAFVKVTLENNSVIYAPLIVGADGKNSTVRKLTKIEYNEVDYNQTAIVVDISHEHCPHHGIAVEKFTPNGPFAILPKFNNYGTESSLVWVEEGKFNVKDLFDKDIIKDLILNKLDTYLGDIQVISEVNTYSLKLIQASKRYHKRIVLVGDAAQSIHPLAGQGFNLGLKDIEALVNLIKEYHNLGIDIAMCLEDYSRSRMLDTQMLICATTGLNMLFSNDILSLKILRRLGLQLFDRSSMLKKTIMKYASGI